MEKIFESAKVAASIEAPYCPEAHEQRDDHMAEFEIIRRVMNSKQFKAFVEAEFDLNAIIHGVATEVYGSDRYSTGYLYGTIGKAFNKFFTFKLYDHEGKKLKL